MKQIIALALLLLLAPAVAAAQFSLTVTEEEGPAWNLAVHYTPGSGGQTALQFDLLLPDGLTVESVAETAGSGDCAMQWALQADGAVRVVVYSASGTAFAAAGRLVFCCRLTAAAGLPAGDYVVRLAGGRASTASGVESVLDEAACTVSVLVPVPASYRVTWLIDGEPFAEQTVKEGAALVPPAVPEREGHTFSGWQNLPEVMPGEDIVVSGHWAVNTYRLFYYLDGELYDTQEVAYGTPLQPLPAPVPEDRFSGWSGLPGTMPAHDVTVTGTTVPSSVAAPVADGRRVPVRTLDGRFAGYDSAALRRSLPAGVYVVGGRKVVVAAR